jgi:hypothetical protein
VTLDSEVVRVREKRGKKRENRKKVNVGRI